MTEAMADFFRIHCDLPREGPGDRDSLAAALAVAGIGRDARILDAGCGPGADVAALLEHAPQGHVLAVDAHGPFAEHVAQRFAGDPRVSARQGDMLQLSGPFDLIWSAGAVYGVGITAALAAWRAVLAPGGVVAFSHLCWRGTDRPEEARAFWAGEFPDMTDADAVVAEIGRAGWSLCDARFLPPSAWQAYYGPLEARLDVLAADAGPGLAAEIAAHRREIAVWRSCGDSFGYLLCVVRP